MNWDMIILSAQARNSIQEVRRLNKLTYFLQRVDCNFKNITVLLKSMCTGFYGGKYT